MHAQYLRTSANHGTKHFHRRKLSLEALESRQLLTATFSARLHATMTIEDTPSASLVDVIGVDETQIPSGSTTGFPSFQNVGGSSTYDETTRTLTIDADTNGAAVFTGGADRAISNSLARVGSTLILSNPSDRFTWSLDVTVSGFIEISGELDHPSEFAEAVYALNFMGNALEGLPGPDGELIPETWIDTRDPEHDRGFDRTIHTFFLGIQTRFSVRVPPSPHPESGEYKLYDLGLFGQTGGAAVSGYDGNVAVVLGDPPPRESILSTLDRASISLSGARTVPEGAAFNLQIGPLTQHAESENARYRINWGDGNISELPAKELNAANRSVTHFYQGADSNPRITVDLADDHGIHPAIGAIDLEIIKPTIGSDHDELEPFSYALVDGVQAAVVDEVFSFNATGRDISAERTARGRYAVEFEGLNAAGNGGGHVQVSPVGNNRYCKVRQWANGSTIADLSANIDCYNASGEYRDSQFNVAIIHPASVSAFVPTNSVNEADIAFAWADNPNTASYVANQTYYHNPAGAVRIQRSNLGRYSVTFEGLAQDNAQGGNVQISGYGQDPNRCSVESWFNSGADFVATVACWSPQGAAADSQFTIGVIPSNQSSTAGFAWADNPSGNNYQPHVAYSHNPSGGDLIADQHGTGTYSVTFPGMNAAGNQGGHIQVTSYGANGHYCNVQSTESNGTDLIANVDCLDTNQERVNGRFSVLAIPAPPGDRFEPNDTIEIATDLGTGNHSIAGLSVLSCGGESEFCSVPDYFEWTPSSASRVDVTIKFEREHGELDLELLDFNGQVLASSELNPDGKHIAWNVEPGIEYYIRVSGKHGSVNDYDLNVESSALLPNGISNIKLNPITPAALAFGDRVEATFNYSTSATNGVQIFVTPLSNGIPTPNHTGSGSVAHTEPSGSATRWFTVFDDATHVDQIQIRMTDPSQSDVLLEQLLDVDYQFSSPMLHDFFNIGTSPISRSTLDLGDRVDFTYEFTTSELGSVIIEAQALSNGLPTPGIQLTHSHTDNVGSGSFGVDTTETHVDQLRLQMWNEDRTRLIYEESVDVDLRFARLSGVLGDFTLDGQLDASDIDELCRATRVQSQNADMDLDRSGLVDAEDLRLLVEDVFHTTAGDANLDRVFDSSDLVALFTRGLYEDGVPGNSSWSSGDFNCDFDFGTGDLIAAFSGGRYEVLTDREIVKLRRHFYIPPHTEGDNDFHGRPNIRVGANLRISSDGTRLETQLIMDAQEIGGDTRAHGTSDWESAYVAPHGRQIVGFSPGARSHVVDIDPEFHFVSPTEVGRLDSELVYRYYVVGDSEGPDAGVDTSVAADFNSVLVFLDEREELDSRVCQVALQDLRFSPPHIRGDTDFDGNGPWINGAVELRLHNNNVEGRAYLIAEEADTTVEFFGPSEDYTTFEGWSDWEQLYLNQPVHGILSPMHWTFEDIFREEDRIHVLADSLTIVGDRDGGILGGTDRPTIHLQFDDILVLQDRCDDRTIVPLRSHFFLPQHTDGNADFSGNGPNIDVTTLLRVSDDRTRLESRVHMRALEIAGDSTRAEGVSEWETAYRAPAGVRIARIDSPLVSTMETFKDTDHAVDFVTTEGANLVDRYEIVGDTDGNDAGQKTAVRVHFHPAVIELEPGPPVGHDTLEIQPHTTFYVPPLVRSDADFGDNQILVETYTELQVLDGRLLARTYAHIQEWQIDEPTANFTTYDGWSAWRDVSSGLIPDGKQIKRLLTPMQAYSSFEIIDGEFPIYFSHGDSLVDRHQFIPPISTGTSFQEIEVELEDVGE